MPSFDAEWLKLGFVQVKGVLSLAKEWMKRRLFQATGAGGLFDLEWMERGLFQVKGVLFLAKE